jgi:excisionase family DNA binding protein
MTVASLARYLHCHTSTIYRLLKAKQIPGFKLSGGLRSDWRFFRSDIDEWIATLYVINPPVTRRQRARSAPP